MTETRDSPGVIAPPPLIAAFAVLCALALDWLVPLRGLADLLPFWPRIAVGVGMVLVARGLAVGGKRHFQAVGTNVMPWRPALRLATGGIYSRVRNPMYVGLVVLIVGLAIGIASIWMFVLLVPTVLVLHYGVVLREERYLEQKFGEDYRRYKATVRRWGLF